VSEHYQQLNRANWDERAPVHAASAHYGFQRFVDDPSHLSDVVRFDLPLLGDIRGARGIHLQCHIGTDTISLSRLGADMVGLDFSGAALDQARLLAQRAGAAVEFVEADVYQAASVTAAEAFDLVFTGIGALCWLPDIKRWAQVVAKLLKPGGRLFIREGHPVLWALAEPGPDDRLVLEHPYFETVEPTVWDESGTYVETDHEFSATLTHEWNHGLGEIVGALIAAGLDLTSLTEHDTVPWDALPGLMRVDERGEYRLIDRPWRLPCSYTLQAVRRR
jgi:SAM-dependent methyltransferase